MYIQNIHSKRTFGTTITKNFVDSAGLMERAVDAANKVLETDGNLVNIVLDALLDNNYSGRKIIAGRFAGVDTFNFSGLNETEVAQQLIKKYNAKPLN